MVRFIDALKAVNVGVKDVIDLQSPEVLLSHPLPSVYCAVLGLN